VIDLQIFCDLERDYLSKPFSLGDYSYATNGHIALRLPRRDDVKQAQHVKAEKAANAINSYIDTGQKTTGPLLPIPDGELPAWKGEPCNFCDGKGELDHCPTCDQPCKCPECDGTGEIRGDHPGVEIAPGAIVSAVYLGWIRALPSPRFRVTLYKDERAEIYFEFDGGAGVVMGRRPTSTDVSLVKHNDPVTQEPCS
jgi:hypothetical protein